MPLEFKPGMGLRDVMRDDFLLSENPFRISANLQPRQSWDLRARDVRQSVRRVL